jgi:hypothetical protein
VWSGRAGLVINFHPLEVVITALSFHLAKRLEERKPGHGEEKAYSTTYSVRLLSCCNGGGGAKGVVARLCRVAVYSRHDRYLLRKSAAELLPHMNVSYEIGLSDQIFPPLTVEIHLSCHNTSCQSAIYTQRVKTTNSIGFHYRPRYGPPTSQWLCAVVMAIRVSAHASSTAVAIREKEPQLLDDRLHSKPPPNYPTTTVTITHHRRCHPLSSSFSKTPPLLKNDLPKPSRCFHTNDLTSQYNTSGTLLFSLSLFFFYYYYYTNGWRLSIYQMIFIDRAAAR